MHTKSLTEYTEEVRTILSGLDDGLEYLAPWEARIIGEYYQVGNSKEQTEVKLIDEQTVAKIIYRERVNKHGNS
jgi:hypothetical protein